MARRKARKRTQVAHLQLEFTSEWQHQWGQSKLIFIGLGFLDLFHGYSNLNQH